MKNETGEGFAVIFLLGITFLIIALYGFYKNTLKPCGSFTQAQIEARELPGRCL
jgi:hypothetical protein